MAQKTLDIDPERQAKRDRIKQSLALVKTEIESTETKLDASRDRRRSLILMALEGAEDGENLFTYDELAALSGLTRSAVYKIVRNGFRDAPLAEQRATATV